MDIHKATVRRSLAPRNGPYWRRVAGGHVGYRKPQSGSESWVAKFRDPDTGKRTSKTLGSLIDMDFAVAEREACKWFGQMLAGGTSGITVRQACLDYVSTLLQQRDAARANDARNQLRPAIDGTIGQRRLERLNARHVREYLNELADTRARSTANRMFRSLRAALSQAKHDGHVASDAAWRNVKEFPGADKRREIYLKPKQRKALIEKSGNDLADYMRGMLLTLCRAGDLRTATVGDFNARAKTLRLRSLKGRGSKERFREVPLTREALTLVKRLAKGKTPSALLYTRDGNAWSSMELSRQTRAAVKAAKLPRAVVLTSLRHSAITDAVANGVPIYQVAKMAGTSAAMIEKHYGHHQPDLMRDQLEKLDLLG